MMIGSACDILPLEGGFDFGAQVVGLQREALANADVRAALRALWLEKGLLVIRDVTDPEYQIDLSRVFGEIELHAVKEVRGKQYPELAAAHFTPDTGMLYDVDGELRGGWLPWHTDTIYDDRLHRGTTLRAITIPTRLGQTGFIDKLESYDALPDRLKQALAGKEVIYKRHFQLEAQRFVTNKLEMIRGTAGFVEMHERLAKLPRALHPAVFRFEELDRMAFNISPHPCFGISGMENEEGDALLREAIEYGIDESRAYFHEWRVNDMVVWDNWRLLHCAEGGPADEERHMDRAQIAGDYGLGRWEVVDAA